MSRVFLGLAVSALAGFGAILATGADTPTEPGKVLVATSFRATKLNGMNVRNMQGEKLGSVQDFVLDVETGKVSYLALSVGGIAGIGNKLFAIPFHQVKFNHGKDEMFFALDMTKDRLDGAPGFDKDSWPDFANEKWWNDVDKYYKANTTTTRTTTTMPDRK